MATIRLPSEATAVCLEEPEFNPIYVGPKIEIQAPAKTPALHQDAVGSSSSILPHLHDEWWRLPAIGCRDESCHRMPRSAGPQGAGGLEEDLL